MDTEAITEQQLIRETVFFSSKTKMSLSLIELRIDNHLSRIMKNHRLVNFANAIQNLPIQSRICEKVIEIMNSCQGLIERKISYLREAREVLVSLSQIRKRQQQDNSSENDFQCKDVMCDMFESIKQVSTRTEQIVWALNSNKEHLRYIARVWSVPEIYQRGYSSGARARKPDTNSTVAAAAAVAVGDKTDFSRIEESISMRSELVMVVEQCERIIDICKLLRVSIASLMKDIYSEIGVDHHRSSSSAIPLEQNYAQQMKEFELMDVLEPPAIQVDNNNDSAIPIQG